MRLWVSGRMGENTCAGKVYMIKLGFGSFCGRIEPKWASIEVDAPTCWSIPDGFRETHVSRPAHKVKILP